MDDDLLASLVKKVDNGTSQVPKAIGVSILQIFLILIQSTAVLVVIQRVTSMVEVSAGLTTMPPILAEEVWSLKVGTEPTEMLLVEVSVLV